MTRNAFATFCFELCILSAPATSNALFANYNFSCLRILLARFKGESARQVKKEFLIELSGNLGRSAVT